MRCACRRAPGSRALDYEYVKSNQTSKTQHGNIQKQKQRDDKSLLGRKRLKERHPLDERAMRYFLFFILRGRSISEIVKHRASFFARFSLCQFKGYPGQ